MLTVAENITKQVKYVMDAHSFTAIASEYRRWLMYYLNIESTIQVTKNANQFGVSVSFLAQVVKKTGQRATHLPYEVVSRFCLTTGIPLALFSCPVDRSGRLISKSGIGYFISFCKDYGFLSILSRNDIMSDIVSSDFYPELIEALEEYGIPYKFTPVPTEPEQGLVSVFNGDPKNWLTFYNTLILNGTIKDSAFAEYTTGCKSKYAISLQRIREFCRVYNIPQRLFVWETENGKLPHTTANADLKRFLKQATGKVHTRLVQENYDFLFERGV